MATRVEVELPDGTNSWIEVSSATRKAVLDYALSENVAPSEAFEEVLGIPQERFNTDEEDSDE